MSNRPQPTQRTDGICRKPERKAITGVPDSSWDKLEQQGLAPKRVHLGGSRCVGWSRRELLEWVEERLAERDAAWQSLGDVAMRVVRKVQP